MSDQSRDTDFVEVLQDIDGGVFLEKICRAFSEVAGGVVDSCDKGKVTLTFDFKKVGQAAQVHIDHKMDYVVPTLHSVVTEKGHKTSTVMAVNRGGKVTFSPEHQGTMFDMRGKPVDSSKEKE